MTSQYDNETEAMMLKRAAEEFDKATEKRLVSIGGQLKPMYVVHSFTRERVFKFYVWGMIERGSTGSGVVVHGSFVTDSLHEIEVIKSFWSYSKEEAENWVFDQYVWDHLGIRNI